LSFRSAAEESASSAAFACSLPNFSEPVIQSEVADALVSDAVEGPAVAFVLAETERNQKSK
jgi:hypothetical protein